MTPTPHTRTGARAVLGLLAAVALGSVAVACGDADGDAATSGAASRPQSTEPATSAADGASAIDVTGVWARTSAAVADAGAVYLQIANTGAADDALVTGSVDASVAAMVELHESTAAPDDTAMGNPTATTGPMATTGGMMSMQPVDRIQVPAGGAVALEPGGYHIMLLGLVEPLAAGDSFDLTLVFEVAGEVVVTADVRDDAP